MIPYMDLLKKAKFEGALKYRGSTRLHLQKLQHLLVFVSLPMFTFIYFLILKVVIPVQ